MACEEAMGRSTFLTCLRWGVHTRGGEMINKIPPDPHTCLKRGQPGSYTETQEGVCM